ncbi:MAG: histidinol dehydrogenase, partial [bacterium]|nr:histidinol dehydrogenase [bacterium]
MKVVDSSGLTGKELEQLLVRTVFDSVRGEEKAVSDILDAVRRRGDDALREFTERFDGVSLDDFLVVEEEFAAAYDLVSRDFLDALALARDNIAAFSRKQLQNSWFTFTEKGSMLGELWRPLASVGCYAPGGTARYPSSVLMTVVPAVVAGVEKVCLCSPARPDGSVDPHVLVAAAEAGVHAFYKLGGAQAVAAMAFGTESVDKVDKIVGPGNIYVTLAKRAVFGYVDIDMLAGPSEVLVLADGTTDPAFAAADMLAQAEHDPRARAILVTTDRDTALSVEAELNRQLKKLPRKKIAEAALEQGGLILLAPDMDKALE